MGDQYLRRLLVVGMTSLVRRSKYQPQCGRSSVYRHCSRVSRSGSSPWRWRTETARVIWAIMARGEDLPDASQRQHGGLKTSLADQRGISAKFRGCEDDAM